MTEAVTVALRVRPLVKSEVQRGCRVAVQRAAPGMPQVAVNRTDYFTYNHVFDSDDTQQGIYDSCVQPKLLRLLNGFNVTILAYGQTGSGKTYTMGTGFDGIMDEHAGLIPRAVNEIFQQMMAMSQNVEYKVTCSFVELYQEQFFDLFSRKKREDSTVDMREDKNGVFLLGLTELNVHAAKEVTDQLMRGSSGRAVAATAMNETSSRSHAIFTLTIVATTKGNEDKTVTTSKFNFVDLAGSERCSKTLACGDRFKEGVNINKGLLALGNVITVLGSNQGTGYVPYRQSKLTRLLQDSLGGNSVTVMIVCVSPADYNVPETLSTLRYADRALQIKNKAVVNLDPHAAEVAKLKDTIQQLRLELLASRGGAIGSIIGAASVVGGSANCESETNCSLENQKLKEQLQQLQQSYASIEKKNHRLQLELHQALVSLADNEMRAHINEISHDKLKAHVQQLKAKLNETLPQAEGEQQQEGEEKLEPLQKQLREISQLISTVDGELLESETALQAHRLECLSDSANNSNNNEESREEPHEQLQTRTDEHTMKQLNLTGELRYILRQLDLKQELHERVTRNLSKLEETDNDEKFKQCEQKIEQLETERRELLDQLRCSKQKDTSAKLAEERRKRLQLLEQEIAEMRRKIVQQANMLKMREKEREKINNLSSEIRAMKESKVKLIRAMRGESERFRQWKNMSEKQLTQLKSKDRKMASEMVRQQTLHAKQRQVLKRKCEEAMATNKRLKDALERQRAAQAQRQKHAKNPAAGYKIEALVDRELEVILSLVDAEHSLEQLMDDRAIINAHYNELKLQQASAENAAEHEQQLANLDEELEMRNAQITDLQQKVCSHDLNSRMLELSENVQNIAESRSINKHLLRSLVQQRRDQAAGLLEQKILLEEQRNQLLEMQQRHDELTKRLLLANCEHEEQMLRQQRNYEEKVALLLRSSDKQLADPQQKMFIEELIAAKDALQSQLDAVEAKRKKPRQNKNKDEEDIVELNDTIESIDSEDDPEWVPKTRKRDTSKSLSYTTAASNTQVDPTNCSQSSLDENATTNMDDSSQAARCRCRFKCNTRRCGCFIKGLSCSSSCKCDGCCSNPFKQQSNNEENAASSLMLNTTVTIQEQPTPLCNAENPLMSRSSEDNKPDLHAELKQETTLGSPAFKNTFQLRSSELTLLTPSSKKKFFNFPNKNC
ncbi:Klp3A [Drosophila busckii]|uniref:Klp3A n=1 Tax=Drosophila busckii TaxID=30019 RepID=A0A0M4F059_DROBS|nr:chromosome-associated kinesin KIF4 [Drosophila busckii]ALC49955.1 Klp3A [Drosophila busckii]